MECTRFLDCGSLRREKIVERFGFSLGSRGCPSQSYISCGSKGLRKRSLLWTSRLLVSDAKFASSSELNKLIASRKSFYLAWALGQEQLGS